MSTTHTIKEQQGVKVLHVNDKPCVCPFRTGVPVQDKFGQLAVVGNDCNSLCPFFNQVSDNNLNLLCLGIVSEIGISK